MEEISHVKLLAVKMGRYTVYVFQKVIDDSFIMCTKLPNWQMSEIAVGEEGFIKYKQVQAGEKYFNTDTNDFKVYQYTNVYLLNFIKKTEIINSNIIL